MSVKVGSGAAKHTAPCTEPPICIKCGNDYFLKDGYDATDYCNLCAQEVAADLLEVLQRIRKRLKHVPAKGKACTLCIAESAVRRARQ